MNSPVRKIDVPEFLGLSNRYPVIDVRSPSEYSYGHIPGAVNIPLFDNAQREAVGTVYKKEGRLKAILRGLELSGPEMTEKLRQAVAIAGSGKVLVHCWRGGMRSEAMAWLFSLGDINTEILEGGYKSYRHHVLEELGRRRNYRILGGLTGSGKTEILRKMKDSGHQVIDLEGIACHKGSAFGSLGQPPQPSSEHFANLLFTELSVLDTAKTIWLEDESRNIGTVFLPDQFYINMQESPVIALMMDINTRMPRLLEEYSTHSREELLSSVKKISKRLGGDRTMEAIESIESGNFRKAIEITLGYYDRTYLYGIKRRPERNITYVETNSDNTAENMRMILAASQGTP